MREEFLPFLIRPCLSILTTTFFQPDEYFQSLEPAHQLVFGYGQLTWEWTGSHPIRSFIYPSFYASIYYALKIFRIDTTSALILAPKVFSGLVAAFADFATYKLAASSLGYWYASNSLFLSLTSIFNALALSRSLSNSMETCLTTLALYHWPFDSRSRQGRTGASLSKALLLASFACMIRPTNAVIWVVLGTLMILRDNSMRNRVQVQSSAIRRRGRSFRIVSVRLRPLSNVLRKAIPIGVAALCFLTVLDSSYFGHFVFTPFNFVKINLSAVSLFYGQNPWHYYFSQGLPILCGVTFPFAVRGWYSSIRGRNGIAAHDLACAVLVTVAIFSCAGHKEWRFLHPVLPILHVFASKILVDIFSTSNGGNYVRRADGRTQPSVMQRISQRLSLRTFHLILIISTSLPLILYVLRYHGRAQIAVMHHLRSQPASEVRSVGFLMPCHSTPWQAYLHRPDLDVKRLWGLKCEPPLDGQKLDTYKDETAIFYEDPVYFMKTHFPPTAIGLNDSGGSTRAYVTAKSTDWDHAWPSHLVMFDALLAGNDSGLGGHPLTSYLKEQGYVEVWSSGWNGWEGDEKRRGPVKVWRWQVRRV